MRLLNHISITKSELCGGVGWQKGTKILPLATVGEEETQPLSYRGELERKNTDIFIDIINYCLDGDLVHELARVLYFRYSFAIVGINLTSLLNVSFGGG